MYRLLLNSTEYQLIKKVHAFALGIQCATVCQEISPSTFFRATLPEGFTTSYLTGAESISLNRPQ